MDKQLIQDQITGLTSRIAELRGVRDIHVKMQGLNTEAEKLRGEALEYEKQQGAAKGELSALLCQRAQAVQKTVKGISDRMMEVLPAGNPAIEVTEDGVFIGWHRPDGTKIAYAGLSGGEKVAFDGALAVALKANVLILEAAEMDEKRFSAALSKLSGAGVQAIVSTCYGPKTVPEGWKEVRL